MELRPGRVRQGSAGSRQILETSRLHQASSGSWRRSFSQKGSSCLVPVNRGARPEHLAHRPANHPEAGGLRHPRIATLGRFLRRNRWLGHPQLIAETGSYWSWFSRRPRFQRNSFLRVPSGVRSGTFAGHPAMPRKDDASACSAKPLGPEPLVSKGLQLQLHFWDRNPFYNDAGSALSLPVTITNPGATQTTTSASVSATINPNATLLISIGDTSAPLAPMHRPIAASTLSLSFRLGLRPPRHSTARSRLPHRTPHRLRDNKKNRQ